jgi:DNA-binding NtrC family response regulator
LCSKDRPDASCLPFTLFPDLRDSFDLEEPGMQDSRAVLIIDDDPSHLQIYGWILKSAGYLPCLALARNDGIDMPKGHPVDVAVLDYRLTGELKATDAAKIVNQAYPGVPIILLSDMYGIPDDIAPFVQAFVRKGEPEKLIAMVKKFAEPRIQSS